MDQQAISDQMERAQRTPHDAVTFGDLVAIATTPVRTPEQIAAAKAEADRRAAVAAQIADLQAQLTAK